MLPNLVQPRHTCLEGHAHKSVGNYCHTKKTWDATATTQIAATLGPWLKELGYIGWMDMAIRQAFDQYNCTGQSKWAWYFTEYRTRVVLDSNRRQMVEHVPKKNIRKTKTRIHGLNTVWIDLGKGRGYMQCDRTPYDSGCFENVVYDSTSHIVWMDPTQIRHCRHVIQHLKIAVYTTNRSLSVSILTPSHSSTSTSRDFIYEDVLGSLSKGHVTSARLRTDRVVWKSTSKH